MSKPYIHSLSSVKQWGGTPEDYLPIHNWFDATKAIIADNRHRALRHHSEGIFLCESIFGVVITNSDSRKVSVRDIGERHILEDFGGRFIPTAQDYLQQIEFQDWMSNGKGEPASSAKLVTKSDDGFGLPTRSSDNISAFHLDGSSLSNPYPLADVLPTFSDPSRYERIDGLKITSFDRTD